MTFNSKPFLELIKVVGLFGMSVLFVVLVSFLKTKLELFIWKLKRGKKKR
jgi:hypothetical protein